MSEDEKAWVALAVLLRPGGALHPSAADRAAEDSVVVLHAAAVDFREAAAEAEVPQEESNGVADADENCRISYIYMTTEER